MSDVENWDNILFGACQDSLRAGLNPPDRPKILYHFTDAAGLMGIIKDAGVWASLATSLNDRSEVTFGVELARKVLQERIKRSETLYLTSIVSFLDPGNVPDEVRLEVNTFVISFCARIDKSGHWLHYGRSGDGFALGFEPGRLQVVPFDLARVLYEEDEQRHAIERIIDNAERALTNIVSSVSPDQQLYATRVGAHMVAAHLWALAPRLKNPAFGEEEEWRLLTYHLKGGAHLELKGGHHGNGRAIPLQTGYRSVDGRVVPHQVLSFSKTRLPLAEIVLGASVTIEPDDPGLRFFLEDLMPDQPIRLVRSHVPVRK
ncbi:DUF2971 domain-containing protein [bacterium]|nr:MAG: DUF2971 domain-containing protein [bacterium]